MEKKSVQLTLFNQGKMDMMWLPAGEPKGKYTFDAYEAANFYIIAKAGEWIVECKDESYILEPSGEKTTEKIIEDRQLINMYNANNALGLYVEDVVDNSDIFTSYLIPNANEITIGHRPENDIFIDNEMVSRNHAVLRKEGNIWAIHDLGSTNGTYVNGARIEKAQLSCGDSIYIIGARIIWGIDFFAISIDPTKLIVNDLKIKKIRAISKTDSYSNYKGKKETLFNRLPRQRQALKADPIEIDAPPMSMKGNGMPLILRMGSSMVMGTTAMMAGRYTMLLTSMVFPFLSHKYTDKERKEYEEKRHTLYREYLERKQREISTEKAIEETALRINYPDLNETVLVPADGKRLWERKKKDDDFLNVRIGEGDTKLIAKVTFSNNQDLMEEDDLEEEMRELGQQEVLLHNVPIRLSLIDDFVCGVYGNSDIITVFIRNLITQIVTYHSYDEVKLVLLSNESQLECLDFIRYLPHTWNDDRSMRFIASNVSEACKISEMLQESVDENIGTDIDKVLKTNPYYIIIALDKKCLDAMESVKTVMQEDKSCGISVIAAFSDYSNLPKECSKIIQLSDGQEHKLININDIDEDEQLFGLDKCDSKQLNNAISIISNVKLKNLAQTYTLPKTITVLEMFNVGKIEHLNIENRWANNNPVQSLKTPIGVGADGSTFMLDLHQKFQGPHGLVAGTTGSGKSEFLLTYILSLAINYHPDEVAFVLIDYKGGGLAGAFDDPERGIHLPHLVGTITNLDGSTIQRSLIAIQSELLRRQRVFNEAKSATGEGTMDIYTYQKLYRSHKVDHPMPHLFIISDEFAELKKQEPEFMDKLISAARIGRSLGIHLILATQKPSGIVNDQILSNTKFRVCLKVQDKADSNDLLKRPDAAELKDTGRFYLQVGYNEFFALGQSAWSGADYIPQDEVVVQRDESIQIIDAIGQSVVEAKKKIVKGKKENSQLVSIVKYISDIASNNGIESRQIWKPALPSCLPYDYCRELYGGNKKGYSLNAMLGMFDDPENQDQYPMCLNISNGNHVLIIGNQGCGKTTFLQTMLFDLVSNYSPEQLNFYLIDCSNHSLRVFKDAPHCGAWVTEDQGGEIRRVFELITDLISERKKLFMNEGVSDYDMYIKKKQLPLVMVIIDSAGGMRTAEGGEEFFTSIAEKMAAASGLGIKFIITACQMNELYSKTKQAISERIALERKDKYDYTDVLNIRCNYTPAKNPGRGLAVYNERPLEFQTCRVLFEDDGQDDIGYFKQKVDAICEKYIECKPARRLPSFDKEQSYQEFSSMFEKGRIPLGYSLITMKPVALPIKQFAMLSVYLGNHQGTRKIFNNFICAADKNDMRVYIVKRRERSCFNESDFEDNVSFINCEKESMSSFLLDIAEEMKGRIAVLQKYTRAHGLKASSTDIYKDTYDYMKTAVEPVLVIFEKFTDVYYALGDGQNDELLAKIFEISRNIGIYHIGGFYPSDSINMAYECSNKFNPDNLNMYLGGRYDKQPLERLPIEYTRMNTEMTFNAGITLYNDMFYPIFVPCGKAEEEYIPEDDRNIFI